MTQRMGYMTGTTLIKHRQFSSECQWRQATCNIAGGPDRLINTYVCGGLTVVDSVRLRPVFSDKLLKYLMRRLSFFGFLPTMDKVFHLVGGVQIFLPERGFH